MIAQLIQSWTYSMQEVSLCYPLTCMELQLCDSGDGKFPGDYP